MKILIVTDAWYPQINGVVRTLTKTSDHLTQMGHKVELITPKSFRTIPCPTYPEIRLSIFPGKKVAKQSQGFQPEAIHVANEGHLGWAGRRYEPSHDRNLKTAAHTRFPEYVHSRIGLPISITYAFLRWFHGSGQALMAPTKTVINDLVKWRIVRPILRPRGVDLTILNPNNRTVHKSTANINRRNASLDKHDTTHTPICTYLVCAYVPHNPTRIF